MNVDRLIVELLLLAPLFESLNKTVFYLRSVANWRRIRKSYLRFIQFASASILWLIFSFVPESFEGLYVQVISLIVLGFAVMDLCQKDGWKHIAHFRTDNVAPLSIFRKLRAATTILVIGVLLMELF